MIILTATTDDIVVYLDGTVATNQLPCIASWRDITTTAYVPAGRSATRTTSRRRASSARLRPAPSE